MGEVWDDDFPEQRRSRRQRGLLDRPVMSDWVFWLALGFAGIGGLRGVTEYRDPITGGIGFHPVATTIDVLWLGGLWFVFAVAMFGGARMLVRSLRSRLLRPAAPSEAEIQPPTGRSLFGGAVHAEHEPLQEASREGTSASLTGRAGLAIMTAAVAVVAALVLVDPFGDDGLDCNRVRNLAELATLPPPNNVVDSQLYEVHPELATALADERVRYLEEYQLASADQRQTFPATWSAWASSVRLQILVDTGC